MNICYLALSIGTRRIAGNLQCEGCYGVWGWRPQPLEAIGGLGQVPHLPEPGGLGAKPQPPEARGLGKSPQRSKKFFCKNNLILGLLFTSW